MAVVTRTFVRESEAIAALDLPALARTVTQPVLLLHGTTSPAWAADVVATLAAHLADATVRVVEGHGHEGVDTAAEQVAAALAGFLSSAA